MEGKSFCILEFSNKGLGKEFYDTEEEALQDFERTYSRMLKGSLIEKKEYKAELQEGELENIIKRVSASSEWGKDNYDLTGKNCFYFARQLLDKICKTSRATWHSLSEVGELSESYKEFLSNDCVEEISDKSEHDIYISSLENTTLIFYKSNKGNLKLLSEKIKDESIIQDVSKTFSSLTSTLTKSSESTLSGIPQQVLAYFLHHFIQSKMEKETIFLHDSHIDQLNKQITSTLNDPDRLKKLNDIKFSKMKQNLQSLREIYNILKKEALRAWWKHLLIVFVIMVICGKFIEGRKCNDENKEDLICLNVVFSAIVLIFAILLFRFLVGYYYEKIQQDLDHLNEGARILNHLRPGGKRKYTKEELETFTSTAASSKNTAGYLEESKSFVVLSFSIILLLKQRGQGWGAWAVISILSYFWSLNIFLIITTILLLIACFYFGFRSIKKATSSVLKVVTKSLDD